MEKVSEIAKAELEANKEVFTRLELHDKGETIDTTNVRIALEGLGEIGLPEVEGRAIAPRVHVGESVCIDCE